MPAKTKVTKEMILDAAFEVARKTGAENINARTVSQKLNCSTQPVMYHFSTIEQLKRAAYEKSDRFHSEYLMNIPRSQEGAMLEIGLNYIRFSIEEPHLFRFLFQSGFAVEHSLIELIDAEQLTPILSAMQAEMDLTIEQAKEVFVTLALFVHGYASMIVNNSLEYDEKLISAHLVRACKGAILAMQEETK